MGVLDKIKTVFSGNAENTNEKENHEYLHKSKLNQRKYDKKGDGIYWQSEYFVKHKQQRNNTKNLFAWRR